MKVWRKWEKRRGRRHEVRLMKKTERKEKRSACLSHTYTPKHAHTHTPHLPTYTYTMPEGVLLIHSLQTDEREMKTEKKEINGHFELHSAGPGTNLDSYLKPGLPISISPLCLRVTHTHTQKHTKLMQSPHYCYGWLNNT